ncbi:MAG: cytochrome P460 family protein [Hyphomicrobiales bacterium]|nr:cytochrome P460 family protein [Hyphomicrobiales bacterium]
MQHARLARALIGAAAAGILVVGWIGGCAGNRAQIQVMPFGDSASVIYAQELWTALSAANLVGPTAKRSKLYKGQAPHGAVLETLTAKVSVGNRSDKVIVKRNYGPEGVTVKKVRSSRKKHLGAVTVMYKREAGYDPENKNWFWAKYKPDGTLHTNPKGAALAGRVAKGTDQGCIACHKAVADKDYIFGKQN